MSDFSVMRALRPGKEKAQQIAQQQTSGPPRLSQKAAVVAQQMEDLEAELAEKSERGQEVENRLRVVEDMLEQRTREFEKQKAELGKRNEQLQTERDNARDEIARLDGQFDALAASLLKLMEGRRKQNATDAYRPATEGKRAVARALSQEAEDPDAPAIPAFLKREKTEEEAKGEQS